MTNEHSPRRILEIGPAQMPLHHRGDRFELDPDEVYTAVDQSANVFQSAVWNTLREENPGRVLTLQGDLNDLPVPEEPYDEVVCLGSVTTDAAIRRLVEQMPKILKPGGKRRCARLDKDFPDDPESTKYAVLTYERREAA